MRNNLFLQCYLNQGLVQGGICISLEAHNGRQGVRSLPFLPSKLGIAKASFYEVILIFAKTEMRGRDKD